MSRGEKSFTPVRARDTIDITKQGRIQYAPVMRQPLFPVWPVFILQIIPVSFVQTHYFTMNNFPIFLSPLAGVITYRYTPGTTGEPCILQPFQVSLICWLTILKTNSPLTVYTAI